METLTVEGRNAMEQLERLPVEDQREIVTLAVKANPSLIPSGDESKMALWITLIAGVIIVALASIAAAVTLALAGAGELAAAAWPIATAAIAGVIGLFSKSPTSS